MTIYKLKESDISIYKNKFGKKIFVEQIVYIY